MNTYQVNQLRAFGAGRRRVAPVVEALYIGMMKKWIITEKPDLSICPKEYCFNWANEGDRIDEGKSLYSSLEKACKSASLTEVEKSGCQCAFGVCCRLTKEPDHLDLYEPCEPMLKRSGLPVLYFCNPDSLEPADQRRYSVMAKNLWEKNT